MSGGEKEKTFVWGDIKKTAAVLGEIKTAVDSWQIKLAVVGEGIYKTVVKGGKNSRFLGKDKRQR